MLLPTDQDISRIERSVMDAIDVLHELNNTRLEIARLRRDNCHLVANILLQETLNQIEAYLDPQAAIIRAEQLEADRRLADAAGKRAAAFAFERDGDIPF